MKENGRIFSFLDVFEASVSRVTWSTDGVHMKDVWYENVYDHVLGDVLQ